MIISQLFFESSLINAFVFFWLACAVASLRIWLKTDSVLTWHILTASFLGPIALIWAFLYESHWSKNQKRPIKDIDNFKSFFSILLTSALADLIFYLLLVRNIRDQLLSSEILLIRIEIFILVMGLFGGIFLSAINRRVAFYESSWVAFIGSASLLWLKNWSNEVFSYGTSSAYFITIICSSTVLYLIFLTLGGSLGFLIFGEGRFNPYFKYESFIGLRFLMTKRSSQVVSLITVISVIAVTFACSGMIIVMSVMNGFTDDIREKILGANPHLMVFKYGGEFFEYKKIIEKTIDIKDVLSVNPFVLSEGMILYNKNLSGALITGIEVEGIKKSHKLLKYVSQETLDNLKNPEGIPVPVEAQAFDELDEGVLNKESAKNELPAVILGKEMAAHMQVFVGDIVSLVNPIGDIGPTGPMPKAKPFRVAGLFYSGMNEYDTKFAYIRLDHAQEFFGLKDSITGVEYVLADTQKTKNVAQKIDEAIGGYPFYTRDWIQMNRPMFSALQLEKIAMLIILGTLILMSSLLILVTLIMVVMEKGKEIAILKSMGATDSSIMKIFVTYGLVVGSLGAFLGGFFGLSICTIIDKIGIRLDPDVYYISNLPIKIEILEVSFVIIAAILISFLATIPPSLFAARLKPVEGLRYE